MYQHHRDAIETITHKLQTRADIRGIIVAGCVRDLLQDFKSGPTRR